MKLIKTLNPSATLLFSTYGDVSLKSILNTKLFDMEAAKVAPGWLRSLHDKETNKVSFLTASTTGESAEYGVSSFVYRRQVPFDPARLHTFLTSYFQVPTSTTATTKFHTKHAPQDVRKLDSMREQFGWILRSKGFCWIAGRDEVVGEWAHAGRFVTITPLMQWYVDTPEEDWSAASTEEEKEAVRKTFAPGIGDRRQEIVFIGTQLQQAALTEALDACLLSPSAFEQHNLRSRGKYFDPLPCWTQDIAEPQRMWNTVLRVGQNQQVAVGDGMELELSCISMNMVLPECEDAEEEEELADLLPSTASFKVWLDYSDQSTLLCTLRPEKCEQFPLNLSLCSTETEEGKDHYTLRVEAQSLSKRGRTQNPQSVPVQCYEIHIIGVSLHAHAPHDDAESDDADGECPL